MRLLLLSALAATTALAASQDKQLEETIIEAFGGVVNLTMNVTGEIAKVAGSDLSTALPVQSATTNLVNYINNATAALNKFGALNLTSDEALVLGPYTQGLAYTVNASIATLIGKKPDFLQLNLGPLVITSLQQQQNASVDFSKAILGRIPPDIYPVATAINSQITNSLQQGLDCFNGMNETCNATPVNASRTLDYAEDTGAITAAAALPARATGAVAWAVVVGAAAFAI
ncbi:hypothetical protein M409DRAFT_29551 [Zasmidium cellare ATCC 36951]|uniref:Cell wall galactomannoprotein n=1 Tax=Zasmidium cellare ATCC 36951 TaxID=1080233 RepID=A0A6A6BYS7_ZASCE|nr:uncharacterized protein M409DRAFT_29551 [Zasmidium cellare ATCC 36951]KAF2159941.1 hypothetical protein M409DRAFT_29551 [Zasmidium cellare ATCC 36951]